MEETIRNIQTQLLDQDKYYATLMEVAQGALQPQRLGFQGSHQQHCNDGNRALSLRFFFSMATKQDAKRFNQMDEEMFSIYCAFYKLSDDNRARDPDIPVEIDGLHRHLRPYQAFSDLWILLRREMESII